MATDDPVARAGEPRPDLMLVLNPLETLRADQADTIRAMGIRSAVWFTHDP